MPVVNPRPAPVTSARLLLLRNRKVIFAIVIPIWMFFMQQWLKTLGDPMGGVVVVGSGGGYSTKEANEMAAAAADVRPDPEVLKAWRASVAGKCAKAAKKEEVEFLKAETAGSFVLPEKGEAPMRPRGEEKGAVVPCKNVFMDFGANVGDTMGHMMDTGLVGCDRKDLGITVKPGHFNIDTFRIDDSDWNRITGHLSNMVKSRPGGAVGPEDYCYYGVEGNPVFTERLHRLEDWAMATEPRPMAHMHFFTESVGAGTDGPTQLWLDTVNEKQNFWGSSIFKDHQDVRKSASAGNSTAKAADVMGYTVSSLLKKTSMAFDPHASPEDRKGGHFLLKVDIEGGEYPLMIEAHESGVLCEYVKMGNGADLIVEFHSQRVTGRHDLGNKVKEARKGLEECGVTFRQLGAHWG